MTVPPYAFTCASDESSHVTGTALVIDGARSIR
jgi:hypothetical protein